MGSGKTSEPFLDMDLNIEALGAISKSKALQELKSSVGFATADKLNDPQANKLLTNMMKMDEFYNPLCKLQTSRTWQQGPGPRCTRFSIS
jgi:hypothetical protein